MTTLEKLKKYKSASTQTNTDTLSKLKAYKQAKTAPKTPLKNDGRSRFTQEEVAELTKSKTVEPKINFAQASKDVQASMKATEKKKTTEKKDDKITLKKVVEVLTTNKEAQQAARQPVWDVIDKAAAFNDVQGAAMRKYAFGDVNNEATGNIQPTTGNKTVDTIANTAGMISSAFLPSGGGAPSMATPVRNAAEYAASKIIPKAGNVAVKAGRVALRGALESLPYTVQQIFAGEKQSATDMLKTTGSNLLMGVAGELGAEGVGILFKKIGQKLKNNTKLTAKEKSIVDEVVKEQSVKQTAAEAELQDAITTPNVKQSEQLAEELRNTKPMKSAKPVEDTIPEKLRTVVERDLQNGRTKQEIDDELTAALNRGTMLPEQADAVRKKYLAETTVKAQPTSTTGQVNTPTANKVAQNGAQAVTTPKVEPNKIKPVQTELSEPKISKRAPDVRATFRTNNGEDVPLYKNLDYEEFKNKVKSKGSGGYESDSWNWEYDGKTFSADTSFNENYSDVDLAYEQITGKLPDKAKAKTQPTAVRTDAGQANIPSTNKAVQKGAQAVDDIAQYAPRTAKQTKYVEQVTAKLPNDADGLSKKIADLEAKAAKETDKSKLLKINLQKFAAKTKLRALTNIPHGDLPEGTVEAGFSRNVRTDKSMPDQIRKSFDEKPLGYKVKSNEETLAKAEAIMAKGQASAISEYYTMLHGKKYQPETVPLAKLIAKNAQAAGDIATARQVLSDATVKLTEAGQFSQAAKILRESDPETFIMTVQKQLNKLNKDGLKAYKKKWNVLGLTDDEIAKIGKIKKGDDVAFETVMEEIHNRVAKEIPSNAWEKFDSWRRMAMLLNPTTHIRNVVGNVVMGGMQKTSDTIGAAIESIVIRDPNKRTKSILWRKDVSRVKTVSTAWETNKKQLMKGGRWDLESGVGSLKELNSMKPVFKKGLPTKAVEAVTGKNFTKGMLEGTNQFSKELLNAEDNIFVKAVWENSLGSFMKARGINDVTDEAIEYATRRAYEATFKQANLLSTTISKIKNVPVIGRLAEGAIPFSKTPSNIAMRAVEYSPAGIMKALYSGASGKGASAVIEDLSKTVTGTGIAALGYTLAAAGWARGKTSTSVKVEAFMNKKGEQSYSITTPLGSYTVEWGQPFAIPFFMGVAMYEELQNPKYDGKFPEAILNSIYKGGDTLFEMTMMRNIKQILGYGSTTQKIGGVMLSYVEQAIPSVLGKMARSVDPNQRETYDPNPAKEEWNKVIAKVPWLSATLPEKIDNFGEVMKNNSALEQFLSPGYAKGKDTKPFMQELERLYQLEKNTDIIPSVTSGKFTDNSIDYVMTADEYTKFKKTYGGAIMNGVYEDGKKVKSSLAELIASGDYKKKSDENKFNEITKLYGRADKQAKKAFLIGRGVK